MPFVVDASVTLAWCFEDEATPQTEAILDRLINDTAIVPALWELEVSNVLLMGERRGRLTEAKSARFVALLGQLPIHVDSATVEMGAVLAAGRRHELSAPAMRPTWSSPSEKASRSQQRTPGCVALPRAQA